MYMNTVFFPHIIIKIIKILTNHYFQVDCTCTCIEHRFCILSRLHFALPNFQMGVEDGKVFFAMSEPDPASNKHNENMFYLKTAERIFVTVTHFPTCEIKGNGMNLIIVPIIHMFMYSAFISATR